MHHPHVNNSAQSVSKPKRVAWVVVALVCCVPAYLAGSTLAQRTSTAAPPKVTPTSVKFGPLAVEAQDLDVGEVWEEKVFRYDLPIRNEWAGSVVIDCFAVDCASCVRVDSKSVEIGPGQSVTVPVILDLTRRRLRDFGKAQREFAFAIVPVLKNHPNARWTAEKPWMIHGSIKSRVVVDLPALDFGEAIVHGRTPPTRRIRASVHVPAKELVATADRSKLSVRVLPVDSHTDHYDILVTPKINLPPGPFESVVIVEVIDPNGERLAGVTVPITGDVQPEFRLLPARLFLGAHRVGSTAEDIVVLQAPANANAEVTRIETDSPDVRIEPVTVDTSLAGRMFRVVQKITSPGDQRSNVRFLVSTPAGETWAVGVEISYFGHPMSDENSPSRRTTP